MEKVAIVSYYPKGLDRYKDQMATFDFIVAVDSGVNELYEISVMPNVCIGDFDSADPGIIQKMDNIIQLEREKDQTDTHAALEYVQNRCVDVEVTVFVSMRGRADHLFGLLGLYYQFIDVFGRLKFQTDQGEVMMLLPGVYHYGQKNEKYISCFAYAKTVENLSLRGTKYELTNHRLRVGSDLGCSNEFLAKEVTISFTAGILLLYFITEEVNYEKDYAAKITQ